MNAAPVIEFAASLTLGAGLALAAYALSFDLRKLARLLFRGPPDA